jgi:hypothetical protein
MKPYISLVFALFCGANYYVIVLKFILGHTELGGGLLGFFFLPAIVAGGGLIVLKTMKAWQEQEKRGHMKMLVVMHFILFLMNIALVASMI